MNFSKKMSARKFIPALILIAGCLCTLAMALLGVLSLTLQQYLAFASIIPLVLSYLLFPVSYKYLLAIMLGLGLFNVLNFTPMETSASFKVNHFEIKIQPVIALICLLVYAMYFDYVNGLIALVIGHSAEVAERKELEKRNEVIAKFKSRYQSYSNETLEQIIYEKRFVPEAIEAAQIIMEGRAKN